MTEANHDRENSHDYRVNWSEKPNLYAIETLADAFLYRCSQSGMDFSMRNFIRQWVGLNILAKVEERIRDSETEWYNRGLSDAREEIEKPYLRKR